MVKEGSQPVRGPEEGGRRRDGQGGDTFMLKTREAAESEQGWKNPCETSGALPSSVMSRKEEAVGGAAGEVGEGPLNVGGGEAVCRRFSTSLKNLLGRKGSRKLRNEKESPS